MSKPTEAPWIAESGYAIDKYGFFVCDKIGNALWDNGQSDGGVCSHADARLIVASCNTVQRLAEHLGRDPVELSEGLDLVALYDSAEWIEDMLGFHEGSEEPKQDGGEPVIWINANPDNGDFQRALAMLRTALTMLRGE